MTQLIKNAARAALTAAVAAADTSLTVDITKADLFPAADTGTDPVNTVGKDWFKVVLEDVNHNIEIVYVRTRTLGSATMSNLLRGQEGTTAISFASGSICGLRMTSLDMQDAIDLAAQATAQGKLVLNAATPEAQAQAMGTGLQKQSATAFTTAGTATAYTLTPKPAVTAYVANLSFDMTFNLASGDNPTLQISGLTTPPNLVKQLTDGTYANIKTGDIPINHRSRVTLLSSTQALVERLPASYDNDYKANVRFTTTGNIILSGLGTQAGGDWVSALTAGDRIFPKDQTTGSENGIYIAASGAWTRSTDADGVGELTPGVQVTVEEGATLADSIWELTTDGAITIGTTALTFARKDTSSIGCMIQGAAKTLQASATGTSATISISADEIVVKSASNEYQTLRNVSVTGSLAASGANGLDDSAPQAVTISIASPGVVTLNGHGFPANAAVVLATTGALPTGLTAGTTYYVTNPAADTCQLSATKGGAAINTSGSQSGVHTIKSVLAVNTWYSRWVIWNGTTTASLLSSSNTNPVLPSGYTHKAWTGDVYTDGTANKYPLAFKQYGRKVIYIVAPGTNVAAMPQMVTGVQGDISIPTWVAIAIGNFVPSRAVAIDVVSYVPDYGSGISGNIAAPNNGYGALRSTTSPPPLVNFGFVSQGTATVREMMPLESTNIYFAGVGTQFLSCAGWEYNF